jgi:hypothetical protein
MGCGTRFVSRSVCVSIHDRCVPTCMAVDRIECHRDYSGVAWWQSQDDRLLELESRSFLGSSLPFFLPVIEFKIPNLPTHHQSQLTSYFSITFGTLLGRPGMELIAKNWLGLDNLSYSVSSLRRAYAAKDFVSGYPILLLNGHDEPSALEDRAQIDTLCRWLFVSCLHVPFPHFAAHTVKLRAHLTHESRTRQETTGGPNAMQCTPGSSGTASAFKTATSGTRPEETDTPRESCSTLANGCILLAYCWMTGRTAVAEDVLPRPLSRP